MEKRQDKVTEEMVTYLEYKMDELIDEAPELERFILPGGADASASIHIARTVTRRAERLIVSLMKAEEDVPEVVLKYVNRDRKSTRLNSSHVAISYAVFCLKKKITT